MPRIVPAFQCVYCPRGTGEIAVDVEVVRSGPPYTPYTPPDAPPASSTDPTFLVFDADGSAGTRCPHVISYSLYATLYRPARPGKHDLRVMLDNGWSHPWFAAHDPDREVHRHLLVEVCGGRDFAFHLRSPHWQDVARDVKVPGSRLRACVNGTVLVAMEPYSFLEELREAHARMVAFYSKIEPGGPTP